MAGIVAVHCCGYNVNAPNWREVAWEIPEEDKMGRLPTAAWLAIEKNADILSFGTGASRTESGVIEAQYMHDYLLEHLGALQKSALGYFISCSCQKAKSWLNKISALEYESKNTKEEINNFFEVTIGGFDPDQIAEIYFVSSYDHLRLQQLITQYLEESGKLSSLSHKIRIVPAATKYMSRPINETMVVEDMERLPILLHKIGYTKISPDE